ncbi:MAG: hypothetical protein ISS48_00070 [Candidatus Aenigmarchaeota archaeon]|nr:hypothetical protein [Candidatus Aenigmarchaeota archaeon]
MADPFTIAIQKLQEMGAFNFLFPFMLTTAIFYGLLRRSGIFIIKRKALTADGKEVGVETHGVNAIIALIAGFMVWAYPILAGVNIEQQLSMFFMQGTIVTLVLVVVLLLTSMFVPPDVAKQLEKLFEKGRVGVLLIVLLVIGLVILVSSGLINLIFGSIFSNINFSSDIVLTVVVLALLIVPFIFIFRSGGETTTGETKNEEG